jgi:uncharacterized protein (TIGR03086 family)
MDVEAAYRRSVSGWLSVVERVDGNWTAATPCADWDVRELVNHVVGEDRWTKPLVDGRTIADVGNSLDGDLLGDRPVDAARNAASEAVSAVSAKLPEGGLVHLSYGEEAIAQYILQLTADHLIHGWDLAAATGQDRELDHELVGAVSAWFADWEHRYRSTGVVAGRPESARGGSPAADLLIAFGRDPEWSPDR